MDPKTALLFQFPGRYSKLEILTVPFNLDGGLVTFDVYTEIVGKSGTFHVPDETAVADVLEILRNAERRNSR